MLRWALCIAIAVLAVVAGYVRVTPRLQPLQPDRVALDVVSSPSAVPVCEQREAAPSLTDAVNGVGLVLAARPPLQPERIAESRARAAASCSGGIASNAGASFLLAPDAAASAERHEGRPHVPSSARSRARLMVFLI